MQAVTIALMLLAAVPALQPFFTPTDRSLDQRIEGTWRAEDQTWQIARTPQRTDYTLTINQGRGGSYFATLFQVGSNRYIDLRPQANQIITDEFLALHMLPAHTLMRVDVLSDTLQLSPMDNEKTSALLTQQPNLVPHVFIERNAVKPLLVLTGSTAQLKTFVKTQGDRIFARPITFRMSGLAAPAPIPTAAPPERLSGLTSQGEGRPINSAEAALRASRVANDLAEKQFGARPFLPRNYTARYENGKWIWGSHDQGVRGYSAEVKMNINGSEPDVKIYFETPGAAPAEIPEVPAPTPIVPQ